MCDNVMQEVRNYLLHQKSQLEEILFGLTAKFSRPLAYEKAEAKALLRIFRHEQEMADENLYCGFISRHVRCHSFG